MSPLTVDAEGGYSDDPSRVAETVLALVEAGAAGINLEDGGAPPELLASKIEHIKRAAARRKADVFVNARTDVYLRGLVPAPARVEESLARARRYREAGADGIFVPKVVEPAEIRELAASAGIPLNVLACPGLLPARELAGLGVRRLSAGSGIAAVAWGRAAALAAAFIRDGASEPLADGPMPYGAINALFVPR